MLQACGEGTCHGVTYSTVKEKRECEVQFRKGSFEIVFSAHELDKQLADAAHNGRRLL